ncbi:non-hydrolyzing UDP-N-acetylglucosamine 2-epimerase [Chloroflexota bacterium]
MKILTILGTRPEIIRLSRVIPRLDEVAEHVLVHTGQNYDDSLSDVFFRELGVRKPDHFLEARGSFGEQIGTILAGIEKILLAQKPERFLVLGDTNSSLAAVMTKRLGITVCHMEAGNRCYDDRVPEEVNRRIIDHSSDILMPYTERSRANLLREGIPGERIYVTGNPIYEVLQHYAPQITASPALANLGVAAGQFFLVTMHRAENVDDETRLRNLLAGLDGVQRQYGNPVICSLHPRTRRRMEEFKLKLDNPEVRLLEPLGFFDFIALEKAARCVITDSGTVQEECCIFGVPNITVRDTTERPETVECGANLLTGVDPGLMLAGVRTALAQPRGWTPPPEYLVPDVSSKVINIVLGYLY